MTHGTVIADGHTATLLDDEAMMTHARPWSHYLRGRHTC